MLLKELTQNAFQYNAFAETLAQPTLLYYLQVL